MFREGRWEKGRSSREKVILALGTLFFMETIADSALEGVRAARLTTALCLASWRTLSAPGPLFPGQLSIEREELWVPYLQ